MSVRSRHPTHRLYHIALPHRIAERFRRVPDHLFGYWLLLPGLIFLALFTYLPVIMSVIRSVHGPDGGLTGSNYRLMLADPVFMTALKNNVLYAVGVIPPAIALAMLMAWLVNGQLKGTGFLRLSFFSPSILPMVAVASVWLFFYTPGYGLFDTLLGAIGLDGPRWLGDPSTVLPSIMVMTIWKEAGFFMIFYLAALQNMSTELEEASQIEGASRWYHFRRITLPLLMPTTLFVMVVAFTNVFKIVDHLFIMTHGGPNNASQLLLFYIYEVSFRYLDKGYAAALTMVLVVLLVAVSLLQIRLLERRTHYQ